MDSFNIPAQDKIFTGEIVEKKSRFIGELSYAETAEQVAERLMEVRKRHYDARHHCSAYILKAEGTAPDICHSSDDGEPQGTAGKPILEVIKGAGLKNALIIVTRYFGGTLLGTGGLSRAYTSAAKEALARASIRTVRLCQQMEFTFDYQKEGAVRRLLSDRGYNKWKSEYTDRVCFKLPLPLNELESLKNVLVNKMEGQIEMREVGKAEYLTI
ncbi:MAG: YigZ family protein [Lachnospiraceae bacterium]|nr:YigZ family protein [Lachnospiraceae bacterium]